MYMDVQFTNAVRNATMVPKAAVQSIGPIECRLRSSGRRSGEVRPAGSEDRRGRYSGLRILEGLRPGATVVTDGSFLLRAEAIRQHP